jgi:hypothetical protein
MPPRRRAPSAESARRAILELGVLAAFVLVVALVVLPLAVTWATATSATELIARAEALGLVWGVSGGN